MGVKASLLLRHEKEYPLPGGLVKIVYRRLSPLDSERINAARRERGEGAAPTVTEGAEQIVVPQVDSWNLDSDDGSPLPITAENVCRFLPDDVVADLMQQITGRLGGDAEKGEDENPTTAPS
jgi:hypothetical protein